MVNKSEFLPIVEELKVIWKQLIELSNIEKEAEDRKDINPCRYANVTLRCKHFSKELFERRIALLNKLTRKQRKEAGSLLQKSKNDGFPNVVGIDKILLGLCTNEELNIEIQRRLKDIEVKVRA